MAGGRSITVIGAGGNIGSHLVPHLGRLPGIDSVTLVDRDRYEPPNLRSQDIVAADVGRAKAVVQARRLSRIAPGIRVSALVTAVEDVPRGRLRCDVLLACLDSRGARQTVNEIAFRMGVPWIDAGVDGGNRMARISVFAPGGACLECGFDERHYAALEAGYSCAGVPADVPPTNATSGLGALAAALQVQALQQWLAGAMPAEAREIVVDVGRAALYATEMRRNPGCRLGSHEPWRIERIGRPPSAVRLAEVLEARAGAALWIEGSQFIRGLRCVGCGRRRARLRLEASMRRPSRRCMRCGGRMIAAGRDMLPYLTRAALGQLSAERLSLAALGLRPGEIFTVQDERGVRHLELACEEREPAGTRRGNRSRAGDQERSAM